MTSKTNTDKRWPAIGDEFEWDGVRLLTVECDGNGCTGCHFNFKMSESRSQGCHEHICEGTMRLSKKDIKFRKVKQ